MAAGPSRCRTRSASGATTPSSAWRPYDARDDPRDRWAPVPAGAPRGAVRPRLAPGHALRSDVPAHGRARPCGRRRDRRRRPCRRSARVRLRAGPVLPGRLARRAARRLDRQGPPPRRPRSGSGDRLHRVGRRAYAGRRRRARRLRADLPRAGGPVRSRPADLGDLRRIGGRRLVLAGADRLRCDDAARAHVPHRPRGRPRGHGRGRQRRGPRRPARARAQRRGALRGRGRRRRGAPRPRPARPPAGRRRAQARAGPALPGRGLRARGGAQGLRRPRRDPGDLGRGPAARVVAALGAQHGLRLRPHGGPAGGRRGQPAAVPGRRARRRVGRQGGTLRAHLQRVRAAAGRARRHAGLPPRHPPGVLRRDPARRQARARVRRGQRAQGHRGPAQGVRRRADRHELARPRRRLRVRLAAGAARRDGRQAGGGDRLPARDRRGRGPDGAPRRARRGLRGRAPERRPLGGRGPRGRGHPPVGDTDAPVPGPGHPRRHRRAGRRRAQHPAVVLAGKKLVITGVLTKDSIAFAAARQAQELGAEVVLTGFGRARRLTERTAKRLDGPPDVLELDVNNPDDLTALRDELASRWGRVDGVLHAIAFAPEDALGGRFLDTPADSATIAFQTSAFSFKALAVALADLYPSEGASVVGLDFDATVAWPVYDWMGVAKAALEATSRYLARDLGRRGVRVNLVSAGPLGTIAARGIPGFSTLADRWREQAPLGWDTEDPSTVAGTIAFLLSDLSRGITGQVLKVDGGYSAVGAPVVSEAVADEVPAGATS